MRNKNLHLIQKKGDDFIKSLTIKINNHSTEILILKRSMGRIQIIDIINIEIGIRDLIGSKSKKEYINLIIEKISKYKKFKSIFFAVQNEDVIIREYRDLGIIKKKDLYGYINFEIVQDMPVNLGDYIVKYKILSKDKNRMSLQVILFPRYIEQICAEIADNIGARHKYLYINYDIMQKLINKRKISLNCDRCIIMENLSDVIILNSVKEGIVHDSNVFEKGGNIEYILNFLEKDIHIFYYGNQDDFLNKIIEKGYKVDKLKVNLKLDNSQIDKTVDKDISDYIINAGLVV